jgi:formylmethanofuran dehydrogenase subunit E
MDRALWEKAVAFHGHECPGLAIGVRVCEAVIREMDIRPSADEQIVCVTENDACGVDAVQAILSCTLGKGNLIYRDRGKQAFSFFNRDNGQKVRVYLKAVRPEDMDRAAWQAYLLKADTDDLFDLSEPKFDVPERARVFRTVVCDVCKEGAAERAMRLKDGKTVCGDCFAAYGRGWR